ncbi:hypothetical protein [Primorskyibacter sp. S187A]|uniref:hypothetical protein n=1 Tax=Primorskyibacter sp. S187A TaxID=3415130 RepID=UPI003C7CACF0
MWYYTALIENAANFAIARPFAASFRFSLFITVLGVSTIAATDWPYARMILDLIGLGFIFTLFCPTVLLIFKKLYI